jgi:hypothetical protein
MHQAQFGAMNKAWCRQSYGIVIACLLLNDVQELSTMFGSLPYERFRTFL